MTTQQLGSRWLSVGAKALIAVAILALVALPIVLGVAAVREGQRAEYWRALFIEQCVENARCDVEQELTAGPEGAPGVQGIPGQRGLPGRDGQPGRDGADSEVPGPSGSPGRGIAAVSCDSERNVWFVEYSDGTSAIAGGSCIAATGERGEPGAVGETGHAGSSGRGIASLVCGESGEWQVTYTDGVVEVAGICREMPVQPTSLPEVSSRTR